MKPYVLALFLCAAYFSPLFGVLAWAQNDENFDIEKRNLEERFEDYYTRQVILERKALEREKGTGEMRDQRVREVEERERDRKQFVIERAKKVEVSDKMHEQEILERKKAYEQNREAFVRRMQAFKRLENDLKIPGEEELGINLEAAKEAEDQADAAAEKSP